MKENILRVLLSVFIIFTFLAVYQNSSQNYSDKMRNGLSQFSVKSDMPADEASRLVMSEAYSAGFDIMVEDYEMFNNEGCSVFYKTNNTDDFLAIETSKGSIKLDENESFSNIDYKFVGTQYKLLTTSDIKMVFFPFEEFCKKGKEITYFTLYCKTSEKDKVYAAYKQVGLEVTEYNDIVGVVDNDLSIQMIPGLIYLLAILLYTVHNAKKSTLLRMDGFSVTDITARECIRVIPYGAIAFLISFLLSALYIGLIIKASVTEYFFSGLGIIKNAIIILTLAVIIRIVFNYIFCKEKYIKGAFSGNMMYFLISIVKTLTIILLTLSITSFILGVFFPNIEAYLFMKKHSNKIKGLVYFTQNKGGIEQSDLSEIQFAPKLIDFYHDAVINYDAIVCDTSDYLLDENGLPSYLINSKEGLGPMIDVNNNYLKENEVYDVEGNRIFEDTLNSDCLTILIPDNYQWERQLFVSYNNKEIYPDLKVVFKEYDSQRSQMYVYLTGGIGNNQGLLSPAPAIRVINDYALENDWHFKYDLLLNILYSRTMFRTHTDNPSAELAPLIKKYDCQDIIDGIVPLETGLETRIHTAWKSVVFSLLILAAYIFVAALSTFFTADFYCRNHRHLIAARALNGYSFVGTFRLYVFVLFMEYTIVFIAASVIAIKVSKAVVPLLVAMIIITLDLITNLMRCRIQLKKNVYQVSKGEM